MLSDQFTKLLIYNEKVGAKFYEKYDTTTTKNFKVQSSW